MLAVWWERMPERLEWELGALRAAGIDFTVDEEAREAGFIRLDLWPVINGEPLHLVATCPDLYPYFRFEVSAPDLDLEHHQHPFAKNLCFIGRATANWHIRYSLAGFIQERLEGVLEAGRSDDPDAVVGIEERQAEPFGDYYSYQRDALVLVDSGWSLPPEIPGGRLVIGVAERATRLVRGVVLEVHDADGTVLAKADPALARQYPRRLRARWLRCPGPVREGDPRRFLDSVVDRAPQLGWPEWRSVDDGRVDIVGVVYPEEVAWREAGDGWVFLVRHEGSRATGRGGRRRGRERASGIYLARAGRAGRGDLAARVPELAPLAERRVALFGLGALGAPSALALARAGVGGLRLLDQDIVEPGTTVRWPLGLPAAGLTKVADLVPFIAAHYPYTEVKGWDHRLGGVADRPFPDRLILEEMLDGTDLIVAATAEVGVHHALTDLARERGIPYLYTYVTHGYWGGLVARVRPGLTAGCWGCLQHAIDDRTIPPIPADPAEPIQPVGCANPTFPGAGFDAEQIALAAVRLAVQTLTAGAGGGYPDADWDVMTVKLRDHDGRGLAPSWDTHPLARHPGCRACASR